MYHTCIRDVNHIKTHLVEEWQKFDQKIINWAITDQAVASTSEVKEEGTLNIGCKTVDRLFVTDH